MKRSSDLHRVDVPRACLFVHTRRGVRRVTNEELVRALEQEHPVQDELIAHPQWDGWLKPMHNVDFSNGLVRLIAAMWSHYDVALVEDQHLPRLPNQAGKTHTGPVSASSSHGYDPRCASGSSHRLVAISSGGTSSGGRITINASMRRALHQDRRLGLSRAVGMRDGRRAFFAGPITHAANLSLFVDALRYDADLHVVEAPVPTTTLGMIRASNTDWVLATPFQMRIWMRQLGGDAPSNDWSTLVHMTAGCPPELKRYWHAALGARNVYEVFGASEGVGSTLARGDEWEARPGTVGRGFFTTVSVRDDDGREVAPGQVGTVYFEQAGRALAEPVNAFPEVIEGAAKRLVSLGDRGRVDESGYLYLDSRPETRITVGGTTVSAADVEDAILTLPGICDAAVGAMQDVVAGVKVVAFLVQEAGTSYDLASLRAALKSLLNSSALPRRLRTLTTIPRSASGKIDRSRVAQLISTMEREETDLDARHPA